MRNGRKKDAFMRNYAFGLAAEITASASTTLPWSFCLPRLEGDKNHQYHQRSQQHQRGTLGAIAQATFVMVPDQNIAHGGAKGPRQNKGDPEEDHVRDLGEVIGRGDESESAADHGCTTGKAEAGIISKEVTEERGAEGVGEKNGGPIEDLHLAGADLFHGEGFTGEIPDGENNCEDAYQNGGAIGIAEFHGPVHVVGHGGAGGAGGDDHEPVNRGVIALHRELRGQRDHEEPQEDRGTDAITQFQCFGEKVAARLAKGGGEDFHNPKDEGDCGNLAHEEWRAFTKAMRQFCPCRFTGSARWCRRGRPTWHSWRWP